MQKRRRGDSLVSAALAAPTSAFDIPPAPILIPEGPWKEVEGSVNAAKGFKAQGDRHTPFHSTALYRQHQWQYIS